MKENNVIGEKKNTLKNEKDQRDRTLLERVSGKHNRRWNALRKTP